MIDYMHITYNVPVQASNLCMFSVEAMVCGYKWNAFDAPIGEISSCEREVGNVHNTFVLAIK